MRPLIGIPCHADFRDGSRRPVYCNNRTYIHAVERAGGVPVLIPLYEDLSLMDTLLPRLDGLLLSGGADVEPTRYGEARNPLTDEPDKMLDEIELNLASWAVQEDIPTLGVCRGMQVLNVALGGTLYQDIHDCCPGSLPHSRRELPRDFLAHSVEALPGSRMEAVLGTRTIMVNSLHHQAVHEPGKGVVISGRAQDGIAELLEVPANRFALAVQFHPEEIYMKEAPSARLFKAFVKACSNVTGEEADELVVVGAVERSLAM
ncbi:MAG TPA: gamma-glutamyl-gamma-aminobutyrate hydrolase family protein [Ktedonobacteraceae bacterium]|nr:gamma-glutamyl-gamma-aminobutyrate hydrolase family protein [Ktedonobacteraceae bacterium]